MWNEYILCAISGILLFYLSSKYAFQLNSGIRTVFVHPQLYRKEDLDARVKDIKDRLGHFFN